MNFGENRFHFRGCERAHGGGMDISHGTQMQQKRGGGLVVGSFKDQHAIMIPQSPIDIGHLAAHLLACRFDRGRSFDGVVDILEALLSKLDGGNKRRQNSSSF